MRPHLRPTSGPLVTHPVFALKKKERKKFLTIWEFSPSGCCCRSQRRSLNRWFYFPSQACFSSSTNRVTETCGKATACKKKINKKCPATEKRGNICRDSQKADGLGPNMMSAGEAVAANGLYLLSLSLPFLASHDLPLVNRPSASAPSSSTDESRHPRFPVTLSQQRPLEQRRLYYSTNESRIQC